MAVTSPLILLVAIAVFSAAISYVKKYWYVIDALLVTLTISLTVNGGLGASGVLIFCLVIVGLSYLFSLIVELLLRKRLTDERGSILSSVGKYVGRCLAVWIASIGGTLLIGAVFYR